MANTIEQALLGLVQILTMGKRPSPNPATLGGYTPNLSGSQNFLTRDNTGLIMQAQENSEPDGGDSAHRAGVLAFCGSMQDTNNLHRYFVPPDAMTRHPTAFPWNNPKNCTRDQLTGYMAGLWRAGMNDIANKLLDAHKQRGWTCQDVENDVPGSKKVPPIGDPLAPHDIMYLKICAGDPRAALDLASQLTLYTAIVLAPTDEDVELNQLLLQCVVCGQLDIFLTCHSNYKQALHKYWSGEPWRGQRPIATSLIEVVNIESSRYSALNLGDILFSLLPQHLLEELRNLDIEAEVKAFMSGNPGRFAGLMARFMVAALKDAADKIEQILRAIDTMAQMEREIAIAVVTSLRAFAGDAFKKAVKAIDDSHLDPTGIVGTALSVTAVLLGLGTSNDDSENAAFRDSVLKSLDQITQNSAQALVDIRKLQDSMEAHFADLAARIDAGFYIQDLGDMRASVQNAQILLSLRKQSGLTDSLADRIASEVDELRKLIFKIAETYGAGTLAYCMQAYGVVVGLLNALGTLDQELPTTRETFGQGWFKTMLYDIKGPVEQLKALKGIEESEHGTFTAMQQEMLIGVRTLQHSKLFYPKNVPGGEPVEVPVDKWTVLVYFCRINGQIDQAAQVQVVMETRELGVFHDSLANAADLAASGLTNRVPTENAVFVIESFPSKMADPEAAIYKLKLSMGDKARASALNWENSRRMQPAVETMVWSVKTAFGL